MNRCFDISGLGVRFTGLTEPISRRFGRTWSPFERPELAHTFLEVRARIEGAAVPDGTVAAKSMRSRFGALSAWFDTEEGAARAGDDGRLDVRLAPSGAGTQFTALLNLTLAGLAWRLSRSGGAIVHAGGALFGDRAVLLVGPSGSGKSTWVRLAVGAGARSLSDDLVFLDASRGRVEALGSPIRTREYGSPGPGRWPLRALLFPRHGAVASIAPIDRIRIQAGLFANLPWIAETMSPALTGFVDRLIASVPCGTLAFPPDASFLPVIERFLESEAGSRST